MKKFLLGTNWKMHKTVEEAKAYTMELIELTKELDRFTFFIIPPYTDLWEIKNLVKGTHMLIGSQNMHWEEEGEFTGEISPKMLREIGIDIVELGHSERRRYFNETDFTVNKKVLSALRYGFTPLICVGENSEDKEYGVTQEVIGKQVKIALHGVSKEDVVNTWIAYEPVWAIGASGVPAEPSYAGKVHTHIRGILEDLYGEEVAKKVPLLYGGSVNLEKALPLSKQKNVDGLFIGRTAWVAKSFRKVADLLTT